MKFLILSFLFVDFYDKISIIFMKIFDMIEGKFKLNFFFKSFDLCVFIDVIVMFL